MALLIAIESSRNFVSGASGFLQNQPEIMSRKRKIIIIIKKQNNNRSFRRSRKALKNTITIGLFDLVEKP